MDTYDTVYLDFQKAFDKIPNERLMVKVNTHGIQGDAARWIRNLLAGRRQRVCFNQSYSNWTPVTKCLNLQIIPYFNTVLETRMT